MTVSIVKFRITGTSPLLMHNPQAMRSSTDGISKQKKIPTPEEEAEMGCYRNADGSFYLPANAFRESLLGSGVGKKIGKQTAWKMIAVGVFNCEDTAALVSPKSRKPLAKFDKINLARVIVNKTSGVIRARPEIAEWSCDVPFEIDSDFITTEQVLQLFNLAGRMMGVGDWRPQKKGRYGRYQVEIVK